MEPYTKKDWEIMGQKIRRWRELTGLNERQAALVCGVLLEDYKKIETGEKRIEGLLLENISRYSNIPWHYCVKDKSLEEFEQVLLHALKKDQKTLWIDFKANSKGVGEKLYQLRETHHLTQEQMARIANIKKESYISAEKGKTLLNRTSITYIAEFFDIPLVDIINSDLKSSDFIASYQNKFDT